MKFYDTSFDYPVKNCAHEYGLIGYKVEVVSYEPT